MMILERFYTFKEEEKLLDLELFIFVAPHSSLDKFRILLYLELFESYTILNECYIFIQ